MPVLVMDGPPWIVRPPVLILVSPTFTLLAVTLLAVTLSTLTSFFNSTLILLPLTEVEIFFSSPLILSLCPGLTSAVLLSSAPKEVAFVSVLTVTVFPVLVLALSVVP